MVTAVNDITGDSIASRLQTQAYHDRYSKVFGEKIKEDCPVCKLSKTVGKECNHCLRNKGKNNG